MNRVITASTVLLISINTAIPSALCSETDQVARCGSQEDAIKPNIITKKYSYARRVILNNGWKPIVTRNRDGTLKSVNKKDGYVDIGVRDVLKKGFVEIDDCSSDGYCQFSFKNTKGIILHVLTSENADYVLKYSMYCQLVIHQHTDH